MTMRRLRADDVHLWPDGTWCLHEDLGEYGHMSDDYEIITPADPRYETITQEQEA
ncbi:hypothetical protein D3C71_221190 [compost metagenome]